MTSAVQSGSKPQAGHRITITILYNGQSKPIDAEPNESVQSLLERAMNLYGVHQNRHLMALFFTSPIKEIVDLHQSLKQAGVVEGTELLLRPSEVRGG